MCDVSTLGPWVSEVRRKVRAKHRLAHSLLTCACTRRPLFCMLAASRSPSLFLFHTSPASTPAVLLFFFFPTLGLAYSLLFGSFCWEHVSIHPCCIFRITDSCPLHLPCYLGIFRAACCGSVASCCGPDITYRDC